MSELVKGSLEKIRGVVLGAPEKLLPLVKMALGAVPVLGEAVKAADAWEEMQKLETNERVDALYAMVTADVGPGSHPPLDPADVTPELAYPVIRKFLADEDRAKFWAYAALLKAFAQGRVVPADRPRYVRAVGDFLNADLIAFTKLGAGDKGAHGHFISRQDVRDNQQVIRALERWAMVGESSPKGLKIAPGFVHLQGILNEGLATLASLTGH